MLTHQLAIGRSAVFNDRARSLYLFKGLATGVKPGNNSDLDYMTTYAAIDIGSNAMRLAIGRFESSSKLKILTTKRAPVRLGADVFRSGRLSPARIEEGVAAFLGFESMLRAHKVDRVRAVATSALRDARNREIFIERVKRATGIQVEVISGDEEARLIYEAVSHVVPLARGSSLLMDIGGGSVELSLLNHGTIIFSDSVNMGAVRLLEMVRDRSGSEQLVQRLLKRYAERIRSQVIRSRRILSVTRVIGTGGNIDTLGDLKKQILKKKNGHLVEKRELVAIMNKLQKMTLQERIDKLGLRPDRADVIMPAMALVLGVLEETKARAVSIPRTGLREGVLWDLRARSAVSVGLSERQVRSYAVELGRRYSFDEQHAKHATRLALLIFDQTRKLHRLVPEARLLLELAGLLHDVGHVINSDDHHKHSAYIIRESHFVGLTDRQRLIVSLVARYHRGGDPKSRDEHWRNVAKTDQRMVRILAGIVRLVEELDREHTQRVSRVKLRRRGKKLFLSLSAKNRLIVERVGAKARKGLLEKALGVSIVVA